MQLESLYQDIVKWLKHKKCKVHTCEAPYGLTFFYEGFYGMIEVKKSARAKWRPGQKEAIAFWDEWSWGRGIWPENLDEVLAELDEILK